MNLNYLIVYVTDFEKMQDFYINKLGMTNIGSLDPTIFATLRPSGGGATIGLQDKKSSDLPSAQAEHAGNIELGFAVEDVDATYKQWKANDVEIIAEPADMPFGRYMLAKDPEGHYLSAYRFNKRD